MSTEGGEGPRRWGQPSAQDTGTTARLDALARQLAEAARSLQRQEPPQQVMDGVVHLAVAMVPGAGEATITMVGEDRHCYSGTCPDPGLRGLTARPSGAPAPARVECRRRCSRRRSARLGCRPRDMPAE